MPREQGEEQEHLGNTEFDCENAVFELFGSLTQAGLSDLTGGLGQGCIAVPLQGLLVAS